VFKREDTGELKVETDLDAEAKAALYCGHSAWMPIAAMDEDCRGDEKTGALPLKQEKLGTEGRAHGAHHAVAAGASGTVVEVFLHDGENGDGGEVSPLTKTVP
jgi:hypothetical protein